MHLAVLVAFEPRCRENIELEMSLLFFTIFSCAIFYLIDRYLFNYWSRRDIPQADPTFLIGNLGDAIRAKTSIGEQLQILYNKFKQHKFIGIYLTYRPVLLVNDPELIQHVLVKDFSTFHDRPTPHEAAEYEPLVGNLFNLRGQKWRDLRVKLTPTFTSGKLKAMFPIMQDCGQVLTDYIDKNMKNNKNQFDIKELFARFTTSIISSVAFGIENDCINEPDNVFRKMGMTVFDNDLRTVVINMLVFFMPGLFTKLKIMPFKPEFSKFINSIVKQNVEYREKNNVHRNDFMQLLIQLKNQGYVSADKDDEQESAEVKHDSVKKLTLDEIAAQVFVFFVAGFETSSSTSNFCMFELARNPDIQRKVQEEIDRAVKESNEKNINYDVLNQMKYLDCCIDETLRLYPIIPLLFRNTSKDYQVPNSNLVIEKDTAVFLPLLGIQRDPEVYDDPLQFKPERFLDSPHGNGKVNGIFYSPFGTGLLQFMSF
jgi:cytochrome P450 family 6